MENKAQYYAIPKYLNSGKRLCGLPREELLPAVCIFALGFFAKHYAIGFVLAAAWFMGLGYIKTQYGEHIVAYALYWWGSASINQMLFKHTPPAIKRYWLS
ncbi:type IV conjugative transfer system protein TraL [Vibrio lentus]|uniref:type IV conjugative transfer system protein TraL n=1 Tax=Vibrio lentus TaxID=136468 RepID=UPI0039A44A28